MGALGLFHWSICQFFSQNYCGCSVTKLCLTLRNPMNYSTPGFPVLHHLSEFAQIHVHWVGQSNLLILYCPSLLLPSIFPIIRGFSSESAFHIRWKKYWSFSFSISPSNEYSGLIFFKDWLVWSPCCPRDPQESSPVPQFKNIIELHCHKHFNLVLLDFCTLDILDWIIFLSYWAILCIVECSGASWCSKH